MSELNDQRMKEMNREMAWFIGGIIFVCFCALVTFINITLGIIDRDQQLKILEIQQIEQHREFYLHELGASFC